MCFSTSCTVLLSSGACTVRQLNCLLSVMFSILKMFNPQRYLCTAHYSLFISFFKCKRSSSPAALQNQYLLSVLTIYRPCFWQAGDYTRKTPIATTKQTKNSMPCCYCYRLLIQRYQFSYLIVRPCIHRQVTKWNITFHAIVRAYFPVFIYPRLVLIEYESIT